MTRRRLDQRRRSHGNPAPPLVDGAALVHPTPPRGRKRDQGRCPSAPIPTRWQRGLAVLQQGFQVEHRRIDTGDIRRDGQRVIGEDPVAVAVQYDRTRHRLDRALQVANDLLYQ